MYNFQNLTIVKNVDYEVQLLRRTTSSYPTAQAHTTVIFNVRFSDTTWPTIALAMTGKFFNCMAFQLAYLYTSEVYCTPLRVMATLTCSAISRIGSTIGAYAGLLVGIKN